MRGTKQSLAWRQGALRFLKKAGFESTPLAAKSSCSRARGKNTMGCKGDADPVDHLCRLRSKMDYIVCFLLFGYLRRLGDATNPSLATTGDWRAMFFRMPRACHAQRRSRVSVAIVAPVAGSSRSIALSCRRCIASLRRISASVPKSAEPVFSSQFASIQSDTCCRFAGCNWLSDLDVSGLL